MYYYPARSMNNHENIDSFKVFQLLMNHVSDKAWATTLLAYDYDVQYTSMIKITAMSTKSHASNSSTFDSLVAMATFEITAAKEMKETVI